MKRLFLAVVFICTNALAGEPLLDIATDHGHRLQAQFVTRIETNKPPENGLGYRDAMFITAYYRTEPEKPFPRTATSEEVFDVVSNTYVNFIIDGKTTNTIATSTTKLGTLKRSSSMVITTQTNRVNNEIFSPEK
jgi:hypothetical protein